MIRRPPRSTPKPSSAASDVYKRQDPHNATILGDVTAELAYATTYDCVIRAGRKRPKIEIEIAILAKAISVSISNTAFNIESTHSQPASCRATPMKVDDGLEDVRWVHGLGGERLLAASYALLPNLKKKNCHGRGIENFCRLFSTHPWTDVFVSDAWPVPTTYHRP